jgi:hypothetical protein
VVYFISRIQLLRTNGLEPVVVFDGGRLPIKGEEEESRRRCAACTRMAHCMGQQDGQDWQSAHATCSTCAATRSGMRGTINPATPALEQVWHAIHSMAPHCLRCAGHAPKRETRQQLTWQLAMLPWRMSAISAAWTSHQRWPSK